MKAVLAKRTLNTRRLSGAKALLFLCALALASALIICASAAGARAAGTFSGVGADAAADDFEFGVSTSEGFNFGTAYDVSSGYPSVTLRFTKTVDTGAKFWYYLSENDKLPEDATWSEFDVGVTDGSLTASLSEVIADTSVNTSGYYETYIFFSGGLGDDRYVDGTIRKIIFVDSRAMASMKVESLSATVDGKPYDLSANASWENKAVTLTAVTSFTGDPRAVRFWYILPGETEERPFTNIFSSGTDEEKYVTGTVTIGGTAEDAIKTVNDKLEIIAEPLAGGSEKIFEGDSTVRLDMVPPDFTVTATVQTGEGTTEEISSREWTPHNVTLSVNFGDAGEPFSGINEVTYKKINSTGESGEPEQIEPVGGKYSYTWSENGSYSVEFTVRSASGNYSTKSFEIRKDDIQPEILLSASDKNGARIVSAGTQPPTGGRAKFAAGSITFSLALDNTLQQGNTLTYSYSLDGGEWKTLTGTDNVRALTLTNDASLKYPGNEIKFRIEAETGLYAEESFEFAVLSPNFYNDMALIIPEAGESGWINEPVKASFVLREFLSGDIPDGGEYLIYGFYTEAEYSDEAVYMEPVIEAVAERPGYVRYTVTIEQSLNEASYSFRIYDRADNYVELEYDENGNPVVDEEDETVTFPLVTGILKVDTEIPEADISLSLGDVALNEGDWAAGPVTITITPENVPVSGLSCYPIFGEGHTSEEPVNDADGKYSVVVRVTGEYRYRLISGAGNYKDFTVTVNIDSSDIEFSDIDDAGHPIKASIVADSGDEIAQSLYYDEQQSAYILNGVYSDVKVYLGSNHEGHFTVMYMTDAMTDYAVNPDSDNPENFLIALPEDISLSHGTLTYTFRLRSNAVSSDGTYSLTSTSVKLIVNYDKTNFGITIDGYGNAGWHYGEIAFEFNPAASGITVKGYQYSLNGTTWKNIEFGTAIGEDGHAVWSYGGEPVEIEGFPEITGGAYSGTMYFRAVAETGKTSNIVTIEVNVDTTPANPLLAIPDPAAVSFVSVADRGSYTAYEIYSGSALSLSGIWAAGRYGMGRTEFQYAQYVSGSNNPEGVMFQSAEGFKVDADGEYWISAAKGERTEYYYVRFIVYDPETDISVSLEVGGVLSEGDMTGGVTWTESATVSLRASASTAVYFWYSLGNDASGNPVWERLNNEAAVLDSGNIVVWEAVFEGIEGADDPSVSPGNNNRTTISGNARYNLKFRVTDLFGNQAVDDSNYIIRIDGSVPQFELEFITPTHPEGLTDEDIEKWITEAVSVTIVPVATSPGGVRYEYQVGESGEWQLIAGTSFSTNHIVGFDDNGTIVIRVRAESLANENSYVSGTYELNIDQLVPEFSFDAKADRLDDNGETISSSTLAPDQWTNADRVSITITRDADNESPVKYEYKWSDGSAFESWEDTGTALTSDKIRTLTVRAISGDGNGIVVEHSFTVNIDNVAPVIHSGNIRNSETGEPNEYYIDQEITYVEANLKSATYNNFPLSNGQIIATNTVDNSNGGRVEIRVEDMAGNVTTLTFIMTIFPLNVNNITTSTQDRNLLNRLENDYNAAAQAGGLTDSRMQYFETLIQRLKDRLIMLETQIGAYRNYLSQVNSKQSFTLESDYDTMFKYINYFETEDVNIRYPDWMQQAICEGEYRTYYLKLESEFDKLQVLMEEVLAIEDAVVLLPATNVVAREDYQDIIRVYNEYDSLARDQKAVFTPNLLNKLTELRRICEVLLMQDEETGISIDGEQLVGELGGSQLTVTSYAPESQYFIEAQTTLYNQLTAADSRKILSINRLALEGAGAEFNTGEITVTLPIPEDYRQYVYFAVYELSPDGTIKRIETSRIAPDAESVYFTTNTLSTYILATTANVVVAEEPEKIYGSIGGIEVDATMLTYITYAVVAMFVIFVVIVLLVALRRRKFLQSYNRDHKKALIRRGIHSIPKGNPPPPSNPARPIERVGHDPQVFYRKKK